MNLTLFLAIVLGGLLLFVWVKLVAARRAEFIRHYALPMDCSTSCARSAPSYAEGVPARRACAAPVLHDVPEE